MIHRISIQNFRSLVNVDIELAPVTVLIGKSGTGKTNFFDAVRFLRNAVAGGKERLILEQNWRSALPATRDEVFPKFELEFTVSGYAEKFSYKLHFPKHFAVGPNVPHMRESLALGDKCLFDQSASSEEPSKSEWKVPPQVTPLPETGHLAIGRLPSITEAVVAYTVLTSGIGCYSFRDDVLANERSTIGEGMTASERRQNSPQYPEGQGGLNDSASNFISTMKEIGTNLEDPFIRKRILSAVKRVNSSVVSVELDDILRPNFAVVGHRFNDKTLSLKLSQESAGFRRFLAHLLALYQRPAKQTLLFEHPEDGIHPGALEVLAEEFKTAPLDRRGQVILTTHSPRLLDYFDFDQVRVVEMCDLETRIGRLAEEQQDALREGLLDTGELLTVDPARIDASSLEAGR